MSEIAAGRYYIQGASGHVLEASANTYKANGATIQSHALTRTLNQLWEISRMVPGEYRLLNVGGGRVLDAHDADVDRNGGRLQLYDAYPDNRNQRWAFRDLGAGRHALRCVASRTNKVVQADVAATPARLQDYAGAAGQIWMLRPARDVAIVRPSLVDLRANQSPVKDQAGRGACTYFGATAALEAAYKKAGQGDLNLSEEFWSVMAKAICIHPIWSDIRDADYRENQFAGTQGGGGLVWYAEGFRIPLESDVPYRPVDYVPANWDSLRQKDANDFNFSLFTRGMLRAPRYYGARSVAAVAADATSFERVLDLGIEISVHLRERVYGGAHNVLLVGYDKTDPTAPVFFVKNSHGPLGGDPTVHCERHAYEAILGDVSAAEFLNDVVEPSSWLELAFLGRWTLTFDGHRGTLDLYHLPGMGIVPRPAEPDRRLGVYYGPDGRALRVNGSVSGNRIEFWIDSAVPNLPWHQLSGQRFVYFLDSSGTLMTGAHRDADGSKFGGYAVKGSRLTHGRPARDGFAGLANSVWNLALGDVRGSVRFGPGDGPVATGVLTTAADGPLDVEADLIGPNLVSVWLEGSPVVATARFLNHEAGLLCGSTSDGRIFYAAHASSR